jgi:hypothetical protein
MSSSGSAIGLRVNWIKILRKLQNIWKCREALRTHCGHGAQNGQAMSGRQKHRRLCKRMTGWLRSPGDAREEEKKKEITLNGVNECREGIG